MSKVQALRALVNQRLAAVAEDINALFERTRAEYEEELRRSEDENQRRQQLLDQALGPVAGPGPGLNQGLNQDFTDTSWIKEEPEEEEQLPVPVPESSAVCVKSEESPSEQLMETEVYRDHNYSKVQTRDRSSNLSAPETSVHDEDKLLHQVQRAELKKHQCSVCSKRFGWRNVLRRHIRVHTGEKPYSCEVCEKAFSQKSNLVRHMRTHTGQRAYSCSVCDKAFSQKSNLNSHMRIHTGQRPYSCSVCDKAFAHKFCLKRHLSTHRNQRPK